MRIGRLPSLELDVDTPGDLAALRAALAARSGGAPRTRALLDAIAVGRPRPSRCGSRSTRCRACRRSAPATTSPRCSRGAPLDPPLGPADVLVIAHKVVSKAEGRLRALADVEPGERARALAAEHGKDPRHVQAVLDETSELLRADHGRLICRTRHGFTCANAGVDQSNAGAPDTVILLPDDPDGSARALRARLGVGAVVITDSWGRPWRQGQIEVAIGCAGLAPLADWRGADDRDGRAIAASVTAIADEVAAAADLVRGKASGEPAVRVRGLEHAITRTTGRERRDRPPAGGGPVQLARRRRQGWWRPAAANGLPAAACRAPLSAVDGRAGVRAARRRSSKRPRASSTRLPCASDHEPSAFSGPARLAPSGVSAYSTRGGTSGCTRRPTRPSRSIARSVWVRTFSEIGSRSASSWW